METAAFKGEMCRALQALKTKLQRLMEPMAQAEGLTMLSALVLLAVRQGSVCQVGGVCREFGIGQANASTLCKKLEGEGFLLRSRHPGDERVVTLTLTPKGEEALTRLGQRWEVFDPALTRYPPEKLRSILEGVEQACGLLDALSQALPQTAGREERMDTPSSPPGSGAAAPETADAEKSGTYDLRRTGAGKDEQAC